MSNQITDYGETNSSGDTLALPARESIGSQLAPQVDRQDFVSSDPLETRPTDAGEYRVAPEVRMAWIEDIGKVGDLVVRYRELFMTSPATSLSDRAKTIGILSIFKGFAFKEVNQRDLLLREAEASRNIFENSANTFFYFDHLGSGRGEWVLNKQVGEGAEGVATIRYEVSASDSLVTVKHPGLSYRPATDGEVSRLRLTTSAYYRQITSSLYN